MFTMKTLIVFALVCAMMVLTRAAAPPLGRRYNGQTERRLVKRSTFCPCGWSEYTYRYVPTRMNWASAEKNCQSMGGHLASVHNIVEYHEIQQLILKSTHEYTRAWIGGSDAQQEKQWFWIDGTPFSYSNWCRGEPNNLRGRQHCIQMNFSDAKCWDDVECSASLPSVCAKKRE